jgi:hypothetical protein
VLLLIAEHTRSILTVCRTRRSGVGEHEEPRTKPSCCDAEGQPPIDPDLVERFERGQRDLGRLLPAGARTPSRRRANPRSPITAEDHVSLSGAFFKTYRTAATWRGRPGRLAAVLSRSNRVLTLRRILHA